MAVDPQPTAEKNEYLALREAKIARNEQRLLDLGLLRHVHRGSDGQQQQQQQQPPLASSVSQTKAARKRRTAIEPKDLLSHRVAPPLRRSPRLEQERPQELEHPSSVVAVGMSKDYSQRRKRNETAASVPVRSQCKANTEGMTVQQIAETIFSNDATAAPKNNNDRDNKDTLARSNSARSIRLDVQQLISRCLGVPLSSTGKAFVMQTSVQLAARPPPLHHTASSSSSSSPPSSISFNKYSGIQEWASHVVFLWVNLHAPQNEARNEFTHQGRQVTFYGGSRMHDQTPVIQKLKLLGVRAAAANELDSADGIVMWCRSYETHRKAFGPYVCLGRLSLVSYDPTSQPLMFVFQLLDYDTLAGDSQTRAVFASLSGLPL